MKRMGAECSAWMLVSGPGRASALHVMNESSEYSVEEHVDQLHHRIVRLERIVSRLVARVPLSSEDYKMVRNMERAMLADLEASGESGADGTFQRL